MKKLCSLLMAICMLVSVAALSGCGEVSKSDATEKPVESTPATQPTQPEETIPEGNQVGNRCYSFDLEIADENGATGETINPATTGKVTVINFWGTWCGPCKAELPYFDEVASTYDVTVIAIHSRDGKENMPEYIAQNYPDSAMIFAWDKTGEDRFQDDFFIKMGNVPGIPYTIILDADGIITFTKVGMMEHEELIQAIENAGATIK